MVDYIEETEKFIRKRNNGEFDITPIANQFYYLYKAPPYVSSINDHPYRKLLSVCLTSSIREYEENTHKRQKLPLAKECYKWISIAWNTGALKEGAGASKKLTECQEEKQRIEKELETLSADYKRLQNQLRVIRLRFSLESEEEGRERHK